MSDSYDPVRVRALLLNVLLNGVNKHSNIRQIKVKTYLRNVVQDSNEWVPVLQARCHVIFQSLEKITHTRDIWDSRHLHLAVLSPVRIVGQWLSRGTKTSVES